MKEISVMLHLLTQANMRARQDRLCSALYGADRAGDITPARG